MLPTATMPTALIGAPQVESGRPVGGQTPETGQFEALLADSIGTAPKLQTSLVEALGDGAAATDAASGLPEGGKDLPEAARTEPDGQVVAALLAMPPIPLPTGNPGTPPEVPSASAEVAPHQPVLPLAQGQTQFQQVEPALPPTLQGTATELPQAKVLQVGPRQAPPRLAASLRLLTEAGSDKPATMAFDVALATSQSSPQPQPFAMLPTPSANPSIPATAAPASAQGPQDFAQLIDRLAAARESGQPQAATLALAHADFGQIELRFAKDGNGLSVAMVSADPDFARAVQAAVPPVSANIDSTAAQPRQHGQGGSQHNAQSGQSHGQTAGQHASERLSQDHFGGTSSGGSHAADRTAQRGIFA